MAAAAAAGLRVGWLELQAPPPPPEGMRAVLRAGRNRVVAVADGWTMSVRPRQGAARLRELLRQQFLGCALVLVHGEVEAPLLLPAVDEVWRVDIPGAGERRYTVAELLAALREPRPFAPAAPVT